MKITDLDERTIKIIDSILKFIYENRNHSVDRHFSVNRTFGNLTSKVQGLAMNDIYELFKLIDELLDVGVYRPDKQWFTVDKTKLNIFQSNGGIHSLIEKERANESEAENYLSNSNALLGLQIQKISKEMDKKNLKFQEKLQQEQLEFFQTTTDRNKDQMLYIYVMIGISILTLLMSAFALYKHY